MPDETPPPETISLVLGGGGPVGLSWLAGIAVGLAENSVDLSAADRFVGTSAGAILGAVLADGGDPAGLLHRPAVSAAEAESVDQTQMAEILGVLRGSGRDPVQARRRVGELAMAASVGAPDDHIARIGGLAGVAQWPNCDLVITSVEVETGHLQAWTRNSGAEFPAALASSTAVPGVYPPIPVNGKHYIDGGMRSPVNADLAAGADVVVIIEPLAHLFPRTPSDRELGSATEVSIAPDSETVEIFGTDVFAASAWEPAYRAGLRQSEDAAALVRDLWPAR